LSRRPLGAPSVHGLLDPHLRHFQAVMEHI
jgi:hypothetical protein